MLRRNVHKTLKQIKVLYITKNIEGDVHFNEIFCTNDQK